MRQLLSRLWNEQNGQDLTEYALLIVFVALTATAAMTGLAGAVSAAFSRAAENLTSTT